MIVYCATSNPGKLREFQKAAPDFGVRALPIKVPPPGESGDTFEANAAEKALAYGQHTPEYLFADDSGLEVDALGGAPGVYSARYAGENATDADNNALLLDRLQGIQARTARFVCVIALVRGGRLVKTFRGTVEGRIIELPRGPEGFGYDPLFFCDAVGCTFGEASIEQKMQVSHRARALDQMFTYLRNSVSI
ncbi:MAG: RdgB/HAM1 family non-canonical purine NTP pyrophosphatase [Bryobacterales bacterium]|nr:RdgB/HAM1 family non-canonical purine NTP pyrophosphatase [Bryobacterales bacterium]